jgi:UDP-N-acetylglucosamine 3-dehydrogenase
VSAPSDARPSILLIGVGRFGRNHLRVLRALHRRRRIRLAGVVARRPGARRALARAGIAVFDAVTPALLQSVDAVDAVTPASTHYALVKRCLPYAHVFVEKPLALTARDAVDLVRVADRHGKRLVVGRIFRFNGAVRRLRDMVRRRRRALYYIEGRFSGPARADAADCGVVSSDIHLLDVLDNVLGETPCSLYCRTRAVRRDCRFDDDALLTLNYRRNLSVFLKLGWTGLQKIRSLHFYFATGEVEADLLAQRLVVRDQGRPARTLNCFRQEPLMAELEHFVDTVTGRASRPDTDVDIRLARLTERALESARTNRVVSL